MCCENDLDRLLQMPGAVPESLLAFFAERDENGISNLDKLREHQQILRCLPETDPPCCYELCLNGCDLCGALDLSGIPSLQGVDAGKNRLAQIDVSAAPELQYLFCQNNRLTELDVRANPLLRHLNAADNPMKKILALAPGREKKFPLELTAADGGTVGLKFQPLYDAQWQETGKWQQSYHAYPDKGRHFVAWKNGFGETLSEEPVWIDEYGASRMLTAVFR